MPRVNSDQFKNYSFEATKDDYGVTHVLVSREGEEKYDPVASIMIDASQRRKNREQQERIYSGESSHYTVEDDDGQMRWAGGTMDDAIDKVSWLGMDKRLIPRRDQPKVLRGLMGVAIDAHGSIPHADSDLSADGSRISRAMSRRYGLKPHPKNPTMRQTLSWNERQASNAVESGLNRTQYILDSPNSTDYWDYSPDEVASLSERLQQVSSSHRPKKIKSTGEPQLPGMEY